MTSQICGKTIIVICVSHTKILQRNTMSITTDNISHDCNVTFNASDIADVFMALKVGKSPGMDNLQGEHFKFAAPILVCLVTMLLNSMFLHGYLPKKVMDTVLIPIIKDKKGMLTDKDNYRPIALTTVFSKIIEKVVLQKYRYQLLTVHNQFGFKGSHGTDQCVLFLRM